jgi:response regulator of citrate/malate metabolism
VIRTLIVEDDPVIAEVLRAYVGRCPPFAVAGCAVTGGQALEFAGREAPDLVLLDFLLPDLPGLEVCRRLRELPGRPADVIAVTSARDVGTVRDAVALGVIQYIVKPFTFDTFSERLRRYAVYRSRTVGVGETGGVDQKGVDDLLRLLRDSPPADLPKGLSRATYDLVVRALQNATEPMSASETAAVTGLSRVSARRYLEHLHNEGVVRIMPRYGTTGRPENRYAWGGKA